MAFRSRLHRRFRRIAVAALILAGTATAAFGNVYQWKDAEGGIHLTDTPPPPGAVPVQAPKTAPKPVRKARKNEVSALRLPPSDCNPKLTRRQCDDYRAAAERDFRELAHDVRLRTAKPDGKPAPSEQDRLDTQHDAVIAEYKARECAERRAELSAARRRHAPRAGETPMDPAERIRVIEEGEHFILEHCR